MRTRISFLVVGMIVMFFVPSVGQSVVQQDEFFHRKDLTPHLSYFVDEASALEFDDVREEVFQSEFQPMGEKPLRLGTTSASIWLKWSIYSTTDFSTEYIVLFEDPSLFEIEQYAIRGHGGVSHLRTGISVPQLEKAVGGNENAFYIYLDPEETETIYYKVRSKNFISLPVSLMSFAQYHEETVIHRSFQGYYYGILLIIIFYALIAYFATRRTYFLFYVLSIFSFGLITGTYDGTTPERWLFLVKLSNGYYDVWMSVVSNAFTLLFMVSFLNLKRVAPRFVRWVRYYMYVLVSILLISFISPQLALNVVSLLSLPAMTLIIIGGTIGVRKKVPQAKFFLAAYIVLSISVFFAIATLFDVFPMTFFSKYTMHIGYILSVFILSIGLALSFNQLRVDLAHQEIEREVEKQRIVSEKNAELEDKVRQRTRDIMRKEANLRAILDTNADDSIWLVDGEFRLIDYNKSFYDNFHVAYGEKLRRDESIIDLVPDEALKAIWKERYMVAFGGKPKTYVDEFEIAGSMQSFEITLYPIREHGEVTGASVYARNITHRKMSEIELKRRNEKLQKLNEELDRFVYSASHDLKAPLASIQGLINITRQEQEHDIGEYLDLMSKSITKLNHFINDIENYSRNARTDVVTKQINWNSMLEGVIEDLEHMEGVEEVEKDLFIDSQVDFISDPNRIKVILSNLVHNSLRYTINYRGAHSGKLEVKGEVTEEAATITVTDNGPGIGEQHLPRIFEMFYRGDEKISGTGLGLYIVKEAIEKLEGSIEVASTVGEGTTFVLRIPNLAGSVIPVEVEKEAERI